MRDCLDDEHVSKGISSFYVHHGVAYETVLGSLGGIVSRFELLRREDIDDDMTWAVAIEAVISDLAVRHPTSYNQLVEAYRKNAAFLSIVALNAVLRNGMDRPDDSMSVNIFSGYSLSDEAKEKALQIAALMKRAEPDVLMAFVQRVMLPFQDHRGERIPFLHPHDDEETVCPVCGRSGLKCKIDELMPTDDGGIAEWRCAYCNASGSAKYRLAFERHVMVDDGNGIRVPNRKWDI